MATARKNAYASWRTEIVPGPLHADLPLPDQFDQISRLGSEDDVAKKIPLGPAPETYLNAIQQYIDAGFDHLFLHQIGHDQHGFFDFISREVIPNVGRQPAGAGISRGA
jgi:hypothetical protein